MSKFIEEVNGHEIIRKFEYTQFDTGYAVLDKNGEEVAWFDDNPEDDDDTDTALEQAREFCKNETA